jgi:exopolysaccharide biosynthesis polyprenyl glycosylphosphotransferase
MVQRVLIFGSSEMTEELISKLDTSSIYQFDVIGVAGKDGLSDQDALEIIEQGKVDSIVIDLSLSQHEIITEIIQKAEVEGISIFMTPRILPSSFMNLSRATIVGVPLISLLPADIPLMGRITKKIVDIVLSLLLVLLISPFLFIIAMMIKITSKGPVIYKQTRVGYDGKIFTMFKFRTMIQDAEAKTGPVWAKDNDERCTKIGGFLRKTNLDEVPQLFNVLSGTMSLIGPRPERPELVQRFKGEIGRYAHKHWVKPGMTGWAQVNGYRGDTSLEKRIQYDIYYIEHWSIWFDLKILLMTPFYGFRNAM